MVRSTAADGVLTQWVVDDFGRTIKQLNADGTTQAIFYCILPSSGLDISSNTPQCPIPSTGEAPADAISFIHTESRDASGNKMGAFVRAYSDRLGRTIRTVTVSFDGSGQPAGKKGVAIAQDTVYGAYGTAILATEPYFLASGSSTTEGGNDVGAKLISYDALGRPVAVYATDANGRAGVQTFGGGGTVSYGSYGSRTSAKTTFAYRGMTKSITNDKGQTSLEEQNPIGQVVRKTDAAGAQLAYQFDAFGNLLTTRDALQNTISITYDILGRKVRMSDPDLGVVAYCYDGAGQLTAYQNSKMRGNDNPGECPSSTTVAVSGWTTMWYDELGRLRQRLEPESTSTWTYDAYADRSTCNKGDGKLCEVSNSSGLNRKITFDNVGRVATQLTTTGTGPGFGMAIGYDATTGRMSSVTYPTGLKVGYGYTPFGYLEQLKLLTSVTVNPLPTAPGGTPGPAVALAAGTVMWQAQAANAWQSIEQQSFGNGLVGKVTYDAATSRPTDRTVGRGGTSEVFNHHYAWDSLGNLVARQDNNGDGVSGAVTETYAHDSVNRLTKYSVSAPTIPNQTRSVDLQYNALGMLLYKGDVGVYTYGSQGPGNSRPHALLNVAGAVNVANAYDLNGNLTSASSGKHRSLAYTSFNLPDSESGIAGHNGTPLYRWVYDESHARVKEVRSITGGTAAGTRTTWYMHPDNVGGLFFEHEDNVPVSASAANPAVKSSRHFLTAGGNVVGVLVSNGNLPTLSAGATAPAALSSITLSKVEYWHKDHLGSLAATTNHVGNVTARYAYDPFGKRRTASGQPDGAGNLMIDWSPAVNAGTGVGFTQHEQLDDIDLVHMNGRLYDSTLGVFAQGDPHVTEPGNLQSYNRYGYCVNNPLNCTDPSGFDSEFGYDYYQLPDVVVDRTPRPSQPTTPSYPGYWYNPNPQPFDPVRAPIHIPSAPPSVPVSPPASTAPAQPVVAKSPGALVSSGLPVIGANSSLINGYQFAAPQVAPATGGFWSASAVSGEGLRLSDVWAGWRVGTPGNSILDLPTGVVGTEGFRLGRDLARFHEFTAAILTPLVGDSPGLSAGAPGFLGAARGFASEAKLFGHFERHGAEFGAKTANDYLQVGRDIMRTGTKVQYLYKGETRTGYVQFMANTRRGDAKFGFVGTSADGAITTIHTQSGKSFWKMMNGDPSIKTITPVP